MSNGYYGDQYNYQRYEGDGGSGDIIITSIEPRIIPAKGGQLIELSGVFPVDESLNVHIGPLGSTSDPKCYSGVIGQSFSCISEDGSTLWCVTPPAIKGIKTLFIRGLTKTGSTTITVSENSFGSTVFNHRRNYSPWYDNGPRRLDLEPQQ